MKIIAIRIKNLASLEGTTEINFTAEPLATAGIFAITGATGAGKSTILDALCLSLYGKTPRYLQARETGVEIHDVQGSTISQGDVRGILRDGTADGFAEVDFAGVDGNYYRATWSVRRARNQADGNIQSDAITLKNITLQTDIPGKKAETYKEIERLVGLNFEQFTRSVLLAQGDFTAFLKANKDEKSSLLEKLTGTHIYSEISRMVYEKCKQEEVLLRELNLQKEGIATFTEAELATLLEEQAALHSRIKILEKQAETVHVEISWHQQLIELNSHQALADSALIEAVTAQKNAANREQKLQQAEQVQQTRTWADALQHAEQQQKQKTAELEALAQKITVLEAQKAAVQKSVAEAEKNLAEKNKISTEALPLLEEAKKQDTLLAEKKEQLAKAKEEAENTAEKSEQQQLEIAAKKAVLTALSTETELIENWKTEHSSRKPIAENSTIIVSKLQETQKLYTQLQTVAHDLETVQEKIREKDAERTTLSTDNITQQTTLETLQETYNNKKKQLLLLPIENIGLEKDETDAALENTIKAEAHWKLFYSTRLDFDALLLKQTADEQEYQIKGAALQQHSQRVIHEAAKKEASAQLLQKARLAATENVETLRAGLVPHEPCPVCGSEEHPYAAHEPKLDHVLATLEQTHRETEQQYLSSLQEQSSLQQTCENLQKTITALAATINSKKGILAALQQDWENFAIADECSNIPDEQKTVWIAEKRSVLKEKQAQLQAQLLAYAAEKQQLESQKARIDVLEKDCNEATNRIKDLERELGSHTEQQERLVQEHAQTTASILDAEAFLSHYITDQGWVDKWKNAPESFLEKMEHFTKKWKTQTEKLEYNLNQYGILSATVTELEKQFAGLTADAQKKAGVLIASESAYLALYKERMSLFEGQPVKTIEAQLQESVAAAKEALEHHQLQQQQLHIDSTKVVTQQEQLLKERSAFENTAQKASQQLGQWLIAYNEQHAVPLRPDELKELLTLTPDWMQTERKMLQAIAEDVTRTQSVLAERTQLLEAHRQKKLSDRALPELNELYRVAQSDLEKNKQSHSEIGFRLQQDEANKNKIGDLLDRINQQAAVTENWSKLNEIIGSYDGKKFRQIAQEYTLDVLLGYANIHLEVLTNRYKIERIPNSLGLQVIDQDMGDEVRTVFSLSGGESFLVSLALALGLASLSSSRMKVESLFIDEGFGSLDPNTLNIAMDALERLHNQGRKVGVISHVQEMTERIPTQIKVSKMASGKSKVEIVQYA